LLRVSSDTLAPGVNVLETAAWETPASFATSMDETRLVLLATAMAFLKKGLDVFILHTYAIN
jgi:hypothetical protein